MKRINAIMAACLIATAAMADNVKFAISNMHCQNCANKVEKTLKANEAVKQVKVNLEQKTVCVAYDEQKTTAEALLNTLTEAKYEAKIAKQCKGCKHKHGAGEGDHKCGGHGEGGHKCSKETK